MLVVPSTRDFRAAMCTHFLPLNKNAKLILAIAQFVHTPPSQKTASSPLANPLPSSPSFGASQRRHAQHSQRLVCDNGLAIRFNKPQTRASLADQMNSKSLQSQSDSSDYPSILHDRRQIDLSHAPPIVQGVQLVSLNDMPDRFRSVFPFPLFNAIQSKCYSTAYQSNDNLVVSAPTGGGKTAILEMAICRLMSGFKSDQCKIVYMAPTKSLCSERQRDWQIKFAALDLTCAELTGDTDNAHLKSVQSANVIVTTPEKWDSMTRKWKDHAKLMQMVKLFLIDEVHILKDARGATLEAVVSRMKSVGSSVRFVALSATVPNSEDVATWLGKDATNQQIPAPRETFGEDFRPVKLQKHVVGLQYKGNDFGFDGACDSRQGDD